MSSIVNEVARLLGEQSPSAEARFLNTFPQKPSDPKGQMEALNQYWRREFLKLASPTISERECLMNDISEQDWLHHFKSTVLPRIVSSNLPRG